MGCVTVVAWEAFALTGALWMISAPSPALGARYVDGAKIKDEAMREAA
jgi:hypothetical protein